MKKYIFYTLIVLFLPALSFSADTKYGGAFLELGVGARPLALGSAYVSLADDGSGFYWNPAGVSFLQQINISLMYANLFNSLENHGFISASLPVFGGAVVSASWIRLAVDDIPRYEGVYSFDDYLQRKDDPGLWLTDPARGSFNFASNAYFITFSKLSKVKVDLGWQYFELPFEVGYGLNFKMLDIKLADKTGSGMGLDGGLRLKLGLDALFADENYGDLNFGLAIQDVFGTNITWDTDSNHHDRIERNWRYGMSYSQPLHFIKSEVLLLYDLNSKYDGSMHFGFEFTYKKFLALRLGTNDGNFTAGAGLTYWGIGIDYAFQLHDLGNLHRVGITLNF
jgi:hypothetical protein